MKLESRIGVEATCRTCHGYSFAVVHTAARGHGHSPFMMDEDGAMRRAKSQALNAMVTDALKVREAVACPACGARDPAVLRRAWRQNVRNVGLAFVTFGLLAWVFFSVDFAPVGYFFAMFGFASMIGLAVSGLRDWRSMPSRIEFCTRPSVFTENTMVADDPARGLRAFATWARGQNSARRAAVAAAAVPSPRPDPATAPPKPTQRRSSLPARYWVLLLAGCVLASVAAYLGLPHAQTLFVTNGCASAARVSIGETTLELGPGTMTKLGWMREGDYQVQVDLQNGYSYQTTIELKNSPIQRLNVLRRAFVFDVLGAQALLWEEIEYSDRNRAGAAGALPESRVLVGQEFYVFRDLDFAFEDPPDSISADRSSRMMRTALSRFPAAPARAIALAAKVTPADLERILRFAEGQLHGGLRDSAFVNAYLGVCNTAAVAPRCEEALRGAHVAPPDADR